MERRKLSAFIPVQNVEDIIEDCLKSIQWVDEVFIVDAFSTDRTVEICRKYPNVKLVQHAYVNSGQQRFWGMPQVAHDWVFIIDSDERCTETLRQEIEKILSQDEIQYDGFNVPIRTWFMGKLLHHDTYLGSGGKRLVRKSTYKNYVLKRVHAKLKIERLTWIWNRKAYLIHDPIRDFTSQWQKLIRYSNWYAEDMFDRGERVYWYHIIVRPVLKFLQFYLIRRGFLDGVRGMILCMIAGISIFMKYYKLWERFQRERHG
jgi:glycosyltransferase involved in cell wall biosynthesis